MTEQFYLQVPAAIGYIKQGIIMNIIKPLLILLCNTALTQIACAISLGGTMNQKIAAQINTTTSATKLLTQNSKVSTFQNTSAHGIMKFMVNNKTSRVYSISWQDKQAANLKEILGNTYYSEFQQAAKKPTLRVPLRGIMVDDGNLQVNQFGSMLSGIQGIATVNSLAP